MTWVPGCHPVGWEAATLRTRAVTTCTEACPSYRQSGALTSLTSRPPLRELGVPSWRPVRRSAAWKKLETCAYHSASIRQSKGKPITSTWDLGLASPRTISREWLSREDATWCNSLHTTRVRYPTATSGPRRVPISFSLLWLPLDERTRCGQDGVPTFTRENLSSPSRRLHLPLHRRILRSVRFHLQYRLLPRLRRLPRRIRLTRWQ